MLFYTKLQHKITTKEVVKTTLDSLKSEGKKIVFTNGCFDILHRGHVEYLCKSKDLGDVLVLGLNTDESVKRLGKSPERPINNQDTRAIILAALECIDYIILFNEDTPLELITFLLPDVLVKGNDYAPEKIVGYEVVTKNGGKVLTVDLVEGFSTTKLINKLKS